MANTARNTLPSLIRWAAIAIILVSIIVATRALPVGDVMNGLEGWLRKLGPWGPVALGAVYVVATILMAPASVLTLAAGALFGLEVGTITVSIASTTGAALAFLIARYLARERVARLVQARPSLTAIDRAIETGGWRIVALLRLSPAVPFNIQNYFYGLTSIRFRSCVLASWIAMLPGTFMYVYLGHAAGAVVAGRTGRSPMEWILMGVGLAATVVVTVYVTRLARAQLRLHAPTTPLESPAEDAQPESASKRSSTLRFTVAAVVFASGAAALHVQSERISGLIKGAFGPPRVELRESYSQAGEGAHFDHAILDRLLHKHVSEGGWVDYAALKANPADLETYIASLAHAPFDSLGRDEKLAFLINAYNAFTLKLILEHYPIASIRDIPSEERWDAKRWRVGPHTWSLSEIEHGQIRPHFVEPRIHFALVCAAIGCPPLRGEAYTATRLEEQLADQAHYVHTHDRWFRYEVGSGSVGLTQLYDWYGSDFDQVAGSAVNFAAGYSDTLKNALTSNPAPSVEWLDYNWTLNDVKNRATPRAAP